MFDNKIYIFFKKNFCIKGLKNNSIIKIKNEYKIKNKKIFIFKKSQINSLKSIIKKTKHSLKNNFIFSLNLKGLGYNIFKTEKNLLKINLNFSHSIIFKIPENLKIVVIKDIIYIYSYSFNLVMKYSTILSKLHKINKYQKVGIFLSNKNYKYKLGKGKQKKK